MNQTSWYDRLAKAFLVASLLGLLAFVLFGCQSYQPPGEDLWLTIR